MFADIRPATVPLEFVAWFAVWLAFVTLQRSLCRSYPGLRTVCRLIFFGTALVAVAPAVWILAVHTGSGPRLLAACNHAFGLGMFAQTAVRALLLVRWLGWSGPGPHLALATVANPPCGVGSEAHLVASLLALSQLTQLSTERPRLRAPAAQLRNS